MTSITPNRIRRSVVQIEILRVVKHCARDVCIKVIEKRSTTEAATELGALRVCQLVLFLVTRIG
jgi:hypothetical protein